MVDRYFAWFFCIARSGIEIDHLSCENYFTAQSALLQALEPTQVHRPSEKQKSYSATSSNLM